MNVSFIHPLKAPGQGLRRRDGQGAGRRVSPVLSERQ